MISGGYYLLAIRQLRQLLRCECYFVVKLYPATELFRITEWFELEGTFKGHLIPPPPATGRDSFHQTRLLRATSNLALNAAREGAATASLGNLFQGLTTLRVKRVILLNNRHEESMVWY